MKSCSVLTCGISWDVQHGSPAGVSFDVPTGVEPSIVDTRADIEGGSNTDVVHDVQCADIADPDDVLAKFIDVPAHVP